MPRSHPLASAPRGEWNGATGPLTGAPCRRGCCWTPLGHSTVVDSYPEHHPNACKCHPKKETR